MNKRKISILLATLVALNSIPFTTASAEELSVETAVLAEEAAEDLAVQISNFNVNLDGDGRVLVEFSIDKEINLHSVNDNIAVKVTNTANGFTKEKNKLWTGYLNDVNGKKYGLENPIVPAGTYSTVFTYSELSGCSLADIKVELTVKNDGVSTTELSGNVETEAPVIKDAGYEIRTMALHGKDAIQVKFTLTEDVDLNNYTINVASETTKKYTGLWWKNFLVNAETNEKYGLSGVIPAGTYLTDFKLDQFDLSDNFENFTVSLTEKASNEIISEETFTAEHPFVMQPSEEFGPEGEVMPEVDAEEFKVDTIGAVGEVKTYTNNNGQTFINFEITEDIDKLFFEDKIEIRWFDAEGTQIKATLSSYSNFLTPVAADDIIGNNPLGEKLGFGEFIPAGYYSISYNDSRAVRAEIKVNSITLPENGIGPDGDVTPELDGPILDGSEDDDFLVDMPAEEGFGDEGNVTPELDGPILDGSEDDDFLVDVPAEEGFGGEGNVTPEVTPDATPDAEDDKTETLPQTGGAGNGMLVGLGAMFTAMGTVLFRKRK